MNRNRWLGCLATLIGLAVSACGGDAPVDSLSSSTAELQYEKTAVRGMWLCDYPVLPTVDIVALVPSVEIDRAYVADRPGFQWLWSPVGFTPTGPVGQFMALFDTVPQAEAYAYWNDNEFILDGVHFWDRPEFADVHDCHVSEVLGSMERPVTKGSQVTSRNERFHVPPSSNARQLLQGWFSGLKGEAERRGISTMYLLYSEQREMAELLYFQDVPLSNRDLFTLPPIATTPPFSQGNSFDLGAWMIVIFPKFQLGDTGKPSIWPFPSIQPTAGDGVCEVSRRETFRNTSDCLPTCGNGVADPGETWRDCPGDVRLFD
jgi:hypothetical protein